MHGQSYKNIVILPIGDPPRADHFAHRLLAVAEPSFGAGLCGRKLTGWLSGKLQTEVHVDKLRLRLFNRVTLDGLYIEDYHQDTMFYARRIVVPLQSLNPFTGRVALGRDSSSSSRSST